MSYFSSFTKKPFNVDPNKTDEIIELTNLAAYSRVFAKLADDVTFYSYYTFTNGDRLDVISEKLYGTTDYYWTFLLINPELSNTYRDLPKEYNDTLVEYIKDVHPGVALKLATGEALAGNFEVGEKVTFNDYEGTVLNRYPTLGYLTVQVTSDESFPINPSQPFTITGETTGDTILIANTVETYNAPHHFVNSNDEWTRWNAGQVTPVTILEYEMEQNDIKSQIRVIRPEFIYEIAQSFEREMKRI